jgi:diacylglycerol O-acyltransferase
MVDGISGVDLLAVLLDTEQVVDLREPAAWTPTAAPSGPALVLDAWKGLGGDLWNLARQVPGAVRDPRRVLRSSGQGVEGLMALGRNLTRTPRLSIEGTIGPHRVWAHSSTTLDDIRVIRTTFGGTVNDVVLAACASGYRTLLQHRGEDPDTALVRTLVPVSLRSDDARGVLDNRVSAILYDLPVHIADAVTRLEKVHDDMLGLKGSHMADVGEAAITVGDLVPPMIVGTTSRLAMRVLHHLPQRSVNTVTTNVPGPQFPLYCLGREMLAYYPYVPISHGVRLGTAILSYNGHVAFGVTGDSDTATDVAVLADAIANAVTELRELAATITAVEESHLD